MEAVFERIAKNWGQLDFLVHSIAFSPKDDLQGRVVDCRATASSRPWTSPAGRFIRMAHLAEPLMKNGGTLFTMTYYGSQMVVENYNIMGVGQGRAGERGALHGSRTRSEGHPRARHLAGAARNARRVRHPRVRLAPATRREEQGTARAASSRIDDVGVATAFLAHDAAQLITGETLYIDGGYHIID